MNQEILICDCGSTEHQIVIHYDDEDNLAYCHIHLSQRGFFRRLIAGVKYIFGYKCRFGHWDEFILSKDHAEKLMQLSLKLNKDGDIQTEMAKAAFKALIENWKK